MPSIAVIGASNDPRKFGNRAVRTYKALGWTVYPVNPKTELVEGLRAYATIADVPGPVDRASLYVPPAVGIQLLEAIRAASAKELWINPGAGSPELLEQADKIGIPTVEACSIVAARTESNGEEDRSTSTRTADG
jgi:predicted CoA-binding protein